MAYDEQLAQRIRAVLRGRRNVRERRMFGGLAFMVRGHMCVGITGQDLVVRVGPERYETFVTAPHARPMDFTGTPMRGMVYVGPGGYRTAAQLERWISRSLTFVKTLPPK